MEFENKVGGSEFCAWVTAHHIGAQSDVSGEFVLPDYYRDIKRVLCMRADTQIDGQYFHAGRLEYEGVVHLSVLYIAEDDSVENASFSMDFSDGIAMEEEQGEHVLVLTPSIAQSGYRVMGPRKLHLKTKVATEILLRRRDCIAPRIEGEHSVRDEASLQYARRTVETMDFLGAQIKDLSLSHTMEAAGSLPPIAQVCYYEASVRFDDCRWQSDGLACRGTLFAQCLYRAQGGEEGGEYVSLQETVPVSVTVEESFLEDYTYRVTPRVRSKKGTVTENAYGEPRLFELTLDYDLQVEAAKNSSVQTVSDLYSTELEVALTQTEMAVPTLTGVYHTNLTVHEGKSRSELGAEAAQSVLLVYADPQIEKTEYDAAKGRLTLEGQARCGALFSCGTDAPCLDAEFTLPIHFELSGIFLKGEPEYRYDCHLVASSGRLDSTQFYPNLELGLDIMVSSVEKQSLCECVTLNAAQRLQKEQALILCYPQKGESLWEIAKRYHVTKSALMELNQMDSEVIKERVLLIPNA